MPTYSRPEIPADLIESFSEFTDFRSGVNQFEVYCRACGKVFYTDRDNSAHIGESIEQGLDNPFLCEDCELDYEETAFETR
ncbi:MAG: hypothetical protein WBO68_00985 [Pyrinomonadaceae bacterium]